MFFNSRAVALILASLVAVLTTAFLWLIPEISETALLVAFVLSFSSTYLLVWVVFEFLVFREIGEIYNALNKIRKKDFSFMAEVQKEKFSTPLKKINQEIYTYALNRQKEIEDLRQMEVFRREFLADVSHELKTPVFAAQGYVHTLLDGAVDDKKVRGKFLRRAAKSLDNLDSLIHDLLTLSQIETGQSKMHFEIFDVLETRQEVFDQLENKAEKKELKLEMVGEVRDSLYVYADKNWIYRVLLNLVSNAIKYTDSGSVKVGVEVTGQKVLINVKDTGLGIPEEHINRVERFFRVDKSRSKERGGTGLGLAIVKHIMEAHDTIVHVKSAKGQGSEFSFELPIGSKDHLTKPEQSEME
jgi:two-component system, OmpR family, phosphate regulon sensor histidine kinase PhoR